MKDLVIFGTGGWAREINQIVQDINAIRETWNLVGFLDQARSRWGGEVHDLPVLQDEQWLARHPHTAVVVAIGDPVTRRRIILELQRLGHTNFPQLIHPLAWISRGVETGPGTVIHAGVLISPDVKIGNHAIVNKNCTIGHDTIIEDYTTIAPSATIAGKVRVGEGCDVGASCTVIQCLRIGNWSIIGAGTVVVRDLQPNVTAVGTPAKTIKERSEGWQDE